MRQDGAPAVDALEPSTWWKLILPLRKSMESAFGKIRSWNSLVSVLANTRAVTFLWRQHL
jgi:hypothetical protein